MKQKKGNKVVLIFGGARSGKSSFAGKLAEKWFRRPLYLATAEAGDREMAERIRMHRRARGARWACVEEPLEIAGVLGSLPPCDGVLLDCLTLWLSNVMHREGAAAVARRTEELVVALRKAGKPVIIVSNEVGLGIVPNSRLGREFRDLAGWLNQDIARSSDTVVFVAAGLPLVMKGVLRR